MGFEPTTIRLELFCSGPLSYGSKVDAYFGSRKATTLFQRSNSFFGILLLPRHPRFPPSFRAWSADTTVFAMLRLRMALCHASCSRQASNLRRTPFRGVPLPVGLREPGRLFLTTVDLRGRYHLEHPEREGKNGMPVMGKNAGRWFRSKRRSEPGGTVSFGLTNP